MKTLLIAMTLASFGATDSKIIEFSSKAQCHNYLKQKATNYRHNSQGDLTGTVGKAVAVCKSAYDTSSPRY